MAADGATRALSWLSHKMATLPTYSLAVQLSGVTQGPGLLARAGVIDGTGQADH
jgi:hypothetical protein